MDAREGPRRHTTAIRLGSAFAAVLGLCAVALIVTLVTLDRTAEAEAEVAQLDAAKHAGHLAAAEVREQYMHQAHTLINWDRSHLGHYQEVVRRTEEATHHLLTLARTPEDRRRAEEIARLARQSDEEFRTVVLPALDTPDRSSAHALGERMDSLVSRVVALNDELNRSLEAEAAAALDRASALRRQARRLSLGCFGMAFLIAAGVGLALVRSIVRPVEALAEGARRIGRGDLTARLEVPGRSEFSELAAAFNQMTAGLAAHQQALLRSQKLASIGQVAAGVAHEINNPLGVILGYLKVLRKRAELGTSEELGIIEDEARQCQRIVQGLLDLARPPHLERGTVDLAELARDAVERLEEAGKLQAVRVTLPDGALRVTGDEGRLRQVVLNVVLNAAEAMPEGGTLVLTAERDGAEATLTVDDTGPGIPPDVLPRVFDPFFTTKKTGTGLGLPIVGAIVDAHGGRVEIDSRPAAGTTVRLHFPAAGEEDAA